MRSDLRCSCPAGNASIQCAVIAMKGVKPDSCYTDQHEVTEIEKRIVDRDKIKRKTVGRTEVEKWAVGGAEHEIQIQN
jgi:hypothetical protein